VTGDFTAHQHAITALAARVQSVDVRAYESLPTSRLASELRPIVSDLLQAASSVVAMVLGATDSPASVPPPAEVEGDLLSPYVPFEQAVDVAIRSQASTSLRTVSDIAFLAQLELRQRKDRLERVATCDSALAIVGECDSALRRISKALTSLDLALARAGVVAEPKLDFTSELEVSLLVRKSCAKLRARILSGGTPTAETLHMRLRLAGTTIAMLVGWDVYPSLRVRDRLQLRDLQRRVLEWLRTDRDTTAGMRVWQDLVGFLEMLAQVNRRQELVDHDTRAVCEAAAKLVGVSHTDLVPAETMALLTSLEGIDEDVDALLASDERASVRAWVAQIERLAQLRKAAPGAE
jgi:hypothetical protein